LLAKYTAILLPPEAVATLPVADYLLQEYIGLPLFPKHFYSIPKATFILFCIQLKAFVSLRSSPASYKGI
jgi:hypothetical protein